MFQDTLVIGRAGKVLRLVRVMRILRVFKVSSSSWSDQSLRHSFISSLCATLMVYKACFQH